MFFPGIIETLADVELVLRAKSSDKFIIFETFTPGAGSNSYKLTTGPLFIFLILPSIPKSNKIFSINCSSGLFLFSSDLLFTVLFFSNKSKEGNLKTALFFLSEKDSLSKVKDCCGFSFILSSLCFIGNSSFSDILFLFNLNFNKVLKFKLDLKIFLKFIPVAKIKNTKVKNIKIKEK